MMSEEERGRGGGSEEGRGWTDVGRRRGMDEVRRGVVTREVGGRGCREARDEEGVREMRGR